ncbi:hypothetical protein NMY22_g6553 [Coprinellus aureogranulatus]|nr:hypothetical protein NMY22_g6553 [Coprinellus aureogranulatus]
MEARRPERHSVSTVLLCSASMGSLLDQQQHAVNGPRPVALGLVVLAGWSFLISTFGQAYVLFNSSILVSRSLYVSSADMIGVLVAFLSMVGGSWLATLAIPQRIRLNAVTQSPLLDTFVNEKRAVEMELREEREAHVRSAQATYVPYFIAGNICLGIWSLLSIFGFHVASQLSLLINLIIHNYAIFIALHNWRRPELRMSRETWRMHVLSKGNAALAVLALWTNSGLLEKTVAPTFPEMLNNGTIFVLMAVGGGPDPILGLFLLYDLIVLAYGTGAVKEWQSAFQYTALVVAAVLAWDVSNAVLNPLGAGIEEADGEIILDTTGN